jgi:hypothetical protein
MLLSVSIAAIQLAFLFGCELHAFPALALIVAVGSVLSHALITKRL